MTSSYPAASRKVPKSSRLACKSSIRPRRSGLSRHCRFSPVIARSEATKQSTLPLPHDGLLRFARNDDLFLWRGAMKHFNLSGWAVSHPALILFLMVALGAAGFFSYERLGRAEDPFFTVKVVNVSAIWPGATAAEMQTQVADPIEKKLQELPFFEKVQTYSKPSFTAMQVAFKDNTPARDVPQLFYQLRKKIGDIKDDLPAGLIGPSINDEYGDVDSVLYMLTSEGGDYAQMKKVAEALRQRLLKVKDVTKVNLYGTQDEK